MSGAHAANDALAKPNSHRDIREVSQSIDTLNRIMAAYSLSDLGRAELCRARAVLVELREGLVRIAHESARAYREDREAKAAKASQSGGAA